MGRAITIAALGGGVGLVKGGGDPWSACHWSTDAGCLGETSLYTAADIQEITDLGFYTARTYYERRCDGDMAWVAAYKSVDGEAACKFYCDNFEGDGLPGPYSLTGSPCIAYHYMPMTMADEDTPWLVPSMVDTLRGRCGLFISKEDYYASNFAVIGEQYRHSALGISDGFWQFEETCQHTTDQATVTPSRMGNAYTQQPCDTSLDQAFTEEPNTYGNPWYSWTGTAFPDATPNGFTVDQCLRHCYLSHDFLEVDCAAFYLDPEGKCYYLESQENYDKIFALTGIAQTATGNTLAGKTCYGPGGGSATTTTGSAPSSGPSSDLAKTGDADTAYLTGGDTEDRDTDDGAEEGVTDRAGEASDDSLASPDAITGIPYTNDTAGMTVAHDDDGDYDNNMTHLVTDTGAEDKGCNAQGFVCDFREASKMGEYSPQDFVWKIVDPTQRGTDGLLQQTLNCEVKITLKATGGASTTNDWFYVPMGTDNTDSTDYCDIEATLREFKDDELYMNDSIHIRGETARLSNELTSDYDLIGEFFDVICGCMTKLSTEATMDFDYEKTSMLTVMTSTGQQRELGVELKLYSDDMMTNEIGNLKPFPDDSQRFYFLAKHLHENDWDAKLQINKCVACQISHTDCTTYSDDTERVVFYEDCETILGGPQERMVNPTSWYHDSTATDTHSFKVESRWADADPDTCPFAAKGFQKFRLAGRDTMKVTCAVTACESLPCKPCDSARRQLFNGRSLQAGDAVDVTMYLNLGAPAEQSDDVEMSEGNSSASKKQGTSFVIMLVVVALLVVASLVAVRRIMQRKSVEATKTVKPVDA